MLEKPSSALIGDLATCKSLEALSAVFNAEILQLGFDYYSMAIVPLDPRFEGGPLLQGTFPESYMRGYEAVDGHTVDPYLQIIATRLKPVFHTDILPQFQTTEIGRKLTVLAQENDIGHGFVVPLPSAGMARGVGYWAGFANTGFDAFVRANEAYLIFIAMHLMAAAEDLGFAPNPVDTPNLTRREVAILRLCADGLTNLEISERLTIVERTVRFHLTNACRKLGTRRRAQALTRAIRLDLIDVSPQSGVSASKLKFF